MSSNAWPVQKGMKKLEQGKPAVKDPAPRQPRQSRAQQVKNKSAAPLQITAEQLLREAHEHKETLIEPPTQRIANEEELTEYRMRKRREFEDGVRKNRMNIGAWMKYAVWEVQQKDFDRARSVFERALDVDYTNTSIWLKYVEMEMKNGFVNFARNLWDRVVQLLPRVDQFWYKYALMEEMLENLPRARQIFERWMQWKPGFSAWGSYIKFEQRHDNIEQARQIYARFVKAHPEVRTYIKWAKFEGRMKQRDKARAVYEQALQDLGEDANDEELFLAFAKFEEICGEWDRARSIYKYALDHVPKHRAMHLYGTYTSFEKQHGDRNNVEEVILSKRRFQYEEDLKTNPKNYDTWFDYLRLEESKGDPAKIRELYERAIGQVPPIAEKRYWERYIYLWISFAIYEELGAKDLTRTRQVYQKALEIIPHKQFTFTKIWIMAAEFEIRCKDLDAFRKLLGTALGMCPRQKLFKRYIELERLLGQADRCRKLYEKYLEFMPTSCDAWSKFAELEASFSEVDRARAIFELAVEQQELDQPEVAWKAYIDFEIKQGAADKTRVLYKRLLDRTKHVKVWISRAQFEAQVQEPQLARLVFQEADKYFKEQEGGKEERVMLIESWLEFEKAFGTADHVREVSMKLPKKVKRRRERKGDDGSTLGFEEFYDYIFPDEDNKAGNLKILEMARAWKKQKTGSS